jgi:ubiquinone/menaquinone biosynthesis C-methylase UbiE
LAVLTGHFDERAREWDDDPRRIRRARAVAAEIRKVVPLSRDTRLLEFGAGTGLLATEVADDVGSVTLVDTSEGMRDQAKRKIAAGVLGPDAVVLDLDLERVRAPARVVTSLSL